MASTAMTMPPRCAIVTGVARRRGIGRSIVDCFLNEGYCVVGSDIQALEEQGSCVTNSRFHFVRADVSDAAQAKSIVQASLERFGHHIHVLVNNAALTRGEEGQDAIQAFDAMLRVNLNGPFYLSHYAIPHMPRGCSSIIHVSSTRALQSEADTAGYTASKAGLCGLTHSQAITYAGHARVNAILPGWINTSDEHEHEVAIREVDKKWHPVGRVGEPVDVAQLCLFLCDESKSGFITGQQFVVDGGTTVKMVYPS
ncbi:uncharacterized protein LOC9631980 [Selaginella moellendorffii]|uniref:uncharacterized protein LOC9631980 n=1 Tax=Selaginella moellendorffii TaxID=88036 RepID=UPI000D1C9F5F|nr:uncharacterized protein LOC9631980 [Selaginella moellendorffii]|eukprot:XP_024531036.1 uncharacterized protein LOC9631980 [Selaginella moellendorffii]